MGLYKKWCVSKKSKDKRKRYWTYAEKEGGRARVRDEFVQTVRSHYGSLELIAEDVKLLGYQAASEILREALPKQPTSRSGELGEILASELVEEEVGLRVPVRRLRHKDAREMAMRGDDFIGAGLYMNKLWLLKGEAKSSQKLGKTTVTEARAALNRDSGRCTPISLLFVANKLLESADPDDKELGRRLRSEVGVKLLPPKQIDHMLFTLSGNSPPSALIEDLDRAEGNRNQYVVNVHVEDHKDFIAETYIGVEDLGND